MKTKPRWMVNVVIEAAKDDIPTFKSRRAGTSGAPKKAISKKA